jgi:hypothetical protein
MKRILIIAAFFAVAIPLLSCNKYDGDALSQAVRQNSKVMPPASVSDQMPSDKLQVPDGARDVEWDKEGSLWVLSYDLGRGADMKEVDVYFDAEGIWIMTKTEMLMKDVPKYIKDYVTSSENYASARFSDHDAEYVETPDENSYLFEVTLNMREIDLKVTEDGVITERYD